MRSTFGSERQSSPNDLSARIAVCFVKIPGLPASPKESIEHGAAIRPVVPEHVAIGVSGDAFAATGLNADCDA